MGNDTEILAEIEPSLLANDVSVEPTIFELLHMKYSADNSYRL